MQKKIKNILLEQKRKAEQGFIPSPVKTEKQNKILTMTEHYLHFTPDNVVKVIFCLTTHTLGLILM